MTRTPRSDVLWAAIRRSTVPLTSRNLAAVTGIPMPIVSALLRRYADRGELTVVGLGPKMARGGLRATVYQVAAAHSGDATAPTAAAPTPVRRSPPDA